MSKKIFHLCLMSFLLAAALIMTGCPQPTKSSGGGGGNSGPTIKTIEWQSDGNGYVQFSTNDNSYHDYYFRCFYDLTFTTPGNVLEVELKKMSGDPDSLFGVIFCAQDTTQKNYYEIVIDTEGYYGIYKYQNDVLSTIKGATLTTYLTKGNGVSNTIKIIKQAGGSYSISFNGTNVTTFTDSTFSNGLGGLSAEVGSAAKEKFPDVPADVRFKFITFKLNTPAASEYSELGHLPAPSKKLIFKDKEFNIK